MPAGTLSTRAGSGTAGYLNGGYLYAEFDKPTGIDVVNTSWRDSNNKYHYYTIYYVGDTNNYVVRYFCTGDSGTSNPLCPSPIGSVATYAGNHAKGYVNGTPPTAEFAHLGGMRKGLGYGVDTDNHAVRGLGTSITTFAGTGSAGFVNGYRTSAKFNTPTQITRDGSSNLYVADAGNHVVRKIDVSGNVTTFSGSGTSGYQDGAPSVARFVWPTSIVFNSADNYFYVADPINNAIRRIDRSGNVSTYSGAPTAGYVDGTLAQARYSSPTDLIIVNGFMYISDSTNNAIRRIDMVNGIVSTYIN